MPQELQILILLSPFFAVIITIAFFINKLIEKGAVYIKRSSYAWIGTTLSSLILLTFASRKYQVDTIYLIPFVVFILVESYLTYKSLHSLEKKGK